MIGLAQSKYEKIDLKSKQLPTDSFSYQEVASYLTKDLKTSTAKARALYVWISHNILYDMNQLRSPKKFATSAERIEEVYQSKMGVCQGYAELFEAMCKVAKLNCVVVSGYTKDAYGNIPNASHAWNVIEIDGDYYPLDLTWAAGYVDYGVFYPKFTDKYFLVPPEEFIKTHMPFDPIWQLSNQPISDKAFILGDSTRLDTALMFTYADSIELYLRSNDDERLEQKYRRIKHSDIEEVIAKEWQVHKVSEIQTSAFNLSSYYYSTSIQYFNTYINHKNKRFRKPKLEVSSIENILNSANEAMLKSEKIFASLSGIKDEELQALILESLKMRTAFERRLEEENKFLFKYKKTWKPLRFFLF
ncbi:MAG: transglutaminase domain-containing protein [Bacteroidota bacterium]